ncbi:extracellular solute-binding protein [Streptomyces sp. NPDC053542]|uniref:extracellular solute-binding protein n=1 Tax=Streptomyces sp. NPDC053542 TaxID=3365710 RepID=UPI0037D3C93D
MPLSRRSLLRTTTGAAASLAAVAGCGRAVARGPDLSGAAGIPRGPVTIRWWAGRVAARDGSDLRPALVRAFRRKYRNITVQLIAAPPTTDVARATLTTQVTSGSPSPDVYMGDIAWPAQFAYNSLAVPLDPLLPKGYWQRYPEELVRALTYQGSVYAFPLYLDEAFLYYRKDLLHKHGLRPPGSWEELASSAAKIQRAGDADLGFVWQGTVYEGLTANVAELVADAGGSILSPDARTVTFDSPAGVRAVSYLRELIARGVTPSSVTTFVEQDSLDAFTSGRSVFLRNWLYAWGVADNPASSRVAGKIGVMRRPGFEGGTGGRSCLGGWCNYLNPHSRHLGAALAFARFLAEEEGQSILAREAAVLPPLLSQLHGKAVARSSNPAFALARDVRLVARPTRTPEYPMVSKAVFTRVNEVLSGGTSVPRALARARGDLRAALRGEAL